MSKLHNAIQKAKREGTLSSAGPSGARSVQDTNARRAGRESSSRPVAELHPPGKGIPRRVEPDGALDEYLVSLCAPASLAGEQFRKLCHVIEQWCEDRGSSLLAVTSPSPDDGKSFASINIAGGLAQDPEAQVLLIDADLRKPAIDVRLGLGRITRQGLADAVYGGDGPWVDRIVRLDDYNLDVLPAGDARTSPYEVLKSVHFSRLLKEARFRYNYVIIDTPPALATADCRLIQQHVDGILLVVSANQTRRQLVEEALAELPSDKLLGLVFNRDQEVQKQYRHYSKYMEVSRGAAED